MIAILGMGGTIAGVAHAKIQTTGYKAGVLSVQTLLEALPEINSIAECMCEQIANVDSADMSDTLWLQLAHRVNTLLAQEDIEGIVITHGSDTMEESAFFLHLVTRSDKPIVFTGAMRPNTALSADGIKNLYGAIVVAKDINAKHRGVMIVMNERIQSARYVSKTHTHNLDAFSCPNIGDLGYVIDDRAYFYNPPFAMHKAQFCLDTITQLPKVDILYSYTNDGSAVAAKALYEHGTQGIVVAGSGAGNIHHSHKAMLQTLMQQGLVVVQSTRVGAGIVRVSEQDSMLGFIGACDLNPQKARVLLALALIHTQNPTEIRQIFEHI